MSDFDWAHLSSSEQAKLLKDMLADAWDEGHRTYRRRGPDSCVCEAWNESECGCGEYGTNIITPNPYRGD